MLYVQFHISKGESLRVDVQNVDSVRDVFQTITLVSHDPVLDVKNEIKIFARTGDHWRAIAQACTDAAVMADEAALKGCGLVLDYF